MYKIIPNMRESSKNPKATEGKPTHSTHTVLPTPGTRSRTHSASCTCCTEADRADVVLYSTSMERKERAERHESIVHIHPFTALGAKHGCHLLHAHFSPRCTEQFAPHSHPCKQPSPFRKCSKKSNTFYVLSPFLDSITVGLHFAWGCPAPADLSQPSQNATC